MISKEEARKMLDEVRENARRLYSCPRHSFGIVLSGHIKNNHVCRNCCGNMSERDIILYARGYKAAGGNPNDVGRFIDPENPGVGLPLVN